MARVKSEKSRNRLSFTIAAITAFSGTAFARPDEPARHKSFVRAADGKIVAVSRGPKLNYAKDLKAAKWGAFDLVSQICFGGGFASGIAEAKVADYTFASSASWNEVSFTIDDGNYNFNPNIKPIADPRRVDNWTRAWRESAAQLAGTGMKDHFTVAKDGVGAIKPDKFVGGGQAKETPVYASTGAAADGRVVGDPAKKDGKRYAVLVSWDKDTASDRHGVNIARMYNTLITIHAIPAANIAVLHADGKGNALGAYFNTNMLNGMQSAVAPAWIGELPNLMPVPIDAGNTRKNWEDALAGKLFNGGKGVAITDKDSLIVYNTGHGGHTSIIEGKLGEKDENMADISVRYIIPDKDAFNRNTNVDPEVGGNASRSFLPNGLFQAQLSFDAALDLSKVKVRFDGGDMLDLTGGKAFAEIPLDPLVDGALQHWRFADLVAQQRVIFDATTIDLYGVPKAMLEKLGVDVMTAGVLNAADQQCVGIVPAPGAGCLLGGALWMLAWRRRRA